MRPHKRINNIIVEDAVQDARCYNDLEFLPDYFYEDSDHVKICREDIIYLFDDCEQDVAEHFINQWSEQENEDISEVCVERRTNTNTSQDI